MTGISADVDGESRSGGGASGAAASLAARLREPLTIRGRQLESRLCLAPMAGLGHAAFREVAGRFGGWGLQFTGMCSARAVPTEKPSVSPVFSWRQEELGTLVCQIFGADPDDMALAAERIQAEGFWGVDLNMGCSVAPIVYKGCGADLLRDPERACRMVEKVRAAVDIPVTVKLRTGWQPDPAPAVAFARMLEQAGADALTFHPRVAPDRRSRPPLMDHIRLVKEAVTVPVFGNGNVFTVDDCRKMLDETGCDGVALGRMGIARPWVFAEWTRGFVPTPETYRETLFDFFEALERWNIPTRAIKLYKKFALYYAANFTYGNRLFGRLIAGETMERMRENAEREFAVVPDISPRPNMLMFTM
ncbi:tRNA dihydrouridine synthase [Desulfovibrio psychrotolerans]|uniref:tRNA-dihydrouridine synthase n=1 Tax=Desulfovibrio psychrotolerans TaxID=415242 RepID=A0A7J0BSV0_9BACT|nr:tRNA-dihydrouridine synthase family protein [Desulfovibrio psychrotolerans]GFM36780.1 tRNA-dihydrouridine synthase [Desulfovibrio psychrotolerans]